MLKDASVILSSLSSQIINFFVVETFHDDFFDEYKKWHKRDFALPHKTWPNSWFTQANDMI